MQKLGLLKFGENGFIYGHSYLGMCMHVPAYTCHKWKLRLHRGDWSRIKLKPLIVSQTSLVCKKSLKTKQELNTWPLFLCKKIATQSALGHNTFGEVGTVVILKHRRERERVNALNFAWEAEGVYFEKSCQNRAFNILNTPNANWLYNSINGEHWRNGRGWHLFVEKKPSASHQVPPQKTCFLLNFCHISCFFQLFYVENVEKAYLDQRLGATYFKACWIIQHV